MSLRTPTENEIDALTAQYTDSSFPRRRESRLVFAPISLDTRWSLS